MVKLGWGVDHDSHSETALNLMVVLVGYKVTSIDT